MLKKKGIITGVKKGTPSLLNYLDKQNIKLGNSIHLISKIEFDHSLEVKINNKKITLSEKICNNLLIEVSYG